MFGFVPQWCPVPRTIFVGLLFGHHPMPPAVGLFATSTHPGTHRGAVAWQLLDGKSQRKDPFVELCSTIHLHSNSSASRCMVLFNIGISGPDATLVKAVQEAARNPA